MVHSLIEQYGADSFTVSIRKTFKDSSSAINWEHKVLRKILNWDKCLNMSAFPAVSEEARHRGNQTKFKKLSNGLTVYQNAGIKWKNKQDTVDPISGKTFRELRREKYNKSLDTNGTRGHTKEYIEKHLIGENNPVHNPGVKDKISETLKQRYAEGYTGTKGKKMPSISEALMRQRFC